MATPVSQIVAGVELPSDVAAGDSVHIVATVTNTGATATTAYLRGRETVFDLVVRGSTGRVVWRRLEGEVTMAILQLRELAAGERIAFSDTWRVTDQRGVPLPAGRYTIVAEFPGDDAEALRSTPRAFTVR